MERNGNLQENAKLEGENSVLSSCLFLDSVGEVVLSYNPDGNQLSWKSVDPRDDVSFLQSLIEK